MNTLDLIAGAFTGACLAHTAQLIATGRQAHRAARTAEAQTARAAATADWRAALHRTD